MWNLFGKLLVSGSGLLISIVLARSLGPEKLGIYATLITVAAVCRLFGDLGLERILNIKLPSFSVQEGGLRKIRFLVQRIIMIRGATIVVISFLLWLLYPAIVRMIGRPELAGYLIPVTLYFSVSVFVSLFGMFHQSLLRIKTVALVDGGEKIGTLFLLLVFFSLGFGVHGSLFAYIVAGGGAALVLAFLGKDLICGEKTNDESHDLIRIGVTSIVYGLVSMGLGSQIDILLMNWFHVQAEEIGFYHLGFNFAVMLGLFSQGIGGISQSVFSEAYTNGGTGVLGTAWQMVTKVFILMALPFYIFALYYAPAIFEIFYGTDFLPASNILRIFIVSITIRIIIGSSFCMSAFYLLQQKGRGLSIQISGGVMNLLLDVILIPLYGLWGAVGATAFSLALTGIGQSFILSRKIRIIPPFVFAGKILFVCFVALIPTLLFTLTDKYALFIAAIVYGVFFLIIMSIIRPLGEEEKQMVKRVNPQLGAIVNYF